MEKLTHLDNTGSARMVDVSPKPDTIREAVARGRITMKEETVRLIEEGGVSKGNVLEIAKIAGIMAAKKTFQLIPLCHPLKLTDMAVKLFINREENCIDIDARAKAFDRTGVEMEAMTAVSVAALTVYDMCKAVDRSMRIHDIVLLRKSGGKSGTYLREGQGWVVSINLSQGKGERKTPVSWARAIENSGLEGDGHAGDPIRQVSLLASESIEKMTNMGLTVGPGAFAENITTAGIDLPNLTIGTQLRIGSTVLMEVSQIGKVCHSRCAIYYQAGDCVMPREGIFARILQGGVIRPEDLILIAPPD